MSEAAVPHPGTVPQRILITPGEPAGIGPDITIQIAQQPWPAELAVVADPDLLLRRARETGLPLTLDEIDTDSPPSAHRPGTLKILPVKMRSTVEPGKLNPACAVYVVETLEKAAALCLKKQSHAIVTGPVHKGIINQAGIPFSGHTEFFAKYCQVPQTIMLFVVKDLKVALATTHLPLSAVSAAITKTHLQTILTLLNTELKHRFQIKTPRILVCGLNPHAGEGGYLGREEIDTINPVLESLRAQGLLIEGALPADTIFTPKYLNRADVVLAMYHDQALPLVKYLGFGHAVNVTLGLPFIRTSVDHGTALDIAGTKKADAGSLEAALTLAIAMPQ
ncbi:4-hydroxythreonine-4-phosphate dehydrogenase [Aquicella siphonis]|uniref:4-hydroxythreonine-4-phosphate dehydrogenase n=1 Tax=Aquicella siphonis TaxID=254247 RepID=A0A5E4PFB7_9COXI|nr:4-hydroxythreonine-4-phosphate dehydrogenase PdxA [Aquicella siphonis]VVC75051.1 4-hydroxythreonine-4-phosphate dehydrogenase [Aquicella siphonis]